MVLRSLRTLTAALLVAAVAAAPAEGAHVPCPRAGNHSAEAHSEPASHRRRCNTIVWSAKEISRRGGLGRIEVHKKLAAVLQRDEGIVTLVDYRSASSDPTVLGRYDDGAVDSLDGDLAFSDDGKWLFYARQTEQFSKDGIHVLDVADRTAPTLASYQPGGGAFRIAYYNDGSAEWVIVLDAIDGLVVNRFVREAGAVVRVHQDPLPALKVGGPASAGIYIDPKDPATGTPLMYVTTGRTGLQIYDLTNPAAPQQLGAWPDVGLAEVEVDARKGRRLVYAATEYWFNASLEPAVVVLDATSLDGIKKVRTMSLGSPPDDLWRVQGMVLKDGYLYVAHSHAGLVVFDRRGRVRGGAEVARPRNELVDVMGAPYAMDVEPMENGDVLVSDAATGTLATVLFGPTFGHGYPIPSPPARGGTGRGR